MHEVGVMQSALEIALEQAARQGANRIHRLALRVGPLSGVVPEALELAFDVVTQGTIAEGAELVVEHVPVVYACPACGLHFPHSEQGFGCPGCRHPGAQVRQGRELELAYLEIS